MFLYLRITVAGCKVDNIGCFYASEWSWSSRSLKNISTLGVWGKEKGNGRELELELEAWLMMISKAQ
jgi:hypothetical protein